MSTGTTEVVTVGSAVTLTADLTDFAGDPEDATAAHWFVRDPAGIEHDMSSSVGHPRAGVYTLDVAIDTPGHWYWHIVTEGLVTAAEGEVIGEDAYQVVPNPTAPTDLRVLVPRVRRYTEGPYGAPQGKPTLSERQLYEMAADACSDIILLTGSLFGHKLIVTARDGRVGFPTGWGTEKVLEEWEAALVTVQAALNHFFFVFRDVKTQRSMKNEGTEITYTLSVNIIRDYLKTLQSARDAAIKGLMRHHPVMDRFASNIRVRDQATVAILEWWDHNSRGGGGGMPGGQEAASIPWTPGWSGPGFVMGY